MQIAWGMAARLCCHRCYPALHARPAPSVQRCFTHRRLLALPNAPRRTMKHQSRCLATPMMQPVQEAVEKIIDARRQTVIYVTGGAASVRRRTSVADVVTDAPPAPRQCRGCSSNQGRPPPSSTCASPTAPAPSPSCWAPLPPSLQARHAPPMHVDETTTQL
jgi:hypothetical protein